MKQSTCRRILLSFGAVMLAAASTLAATSTLALAADPMPSASAGTVEGRIKSRTPASDVIKFERLPDGAIYELPVAATDISLIKDIPLGSVVRVEVDDAIRPARITRVDKVSVPVGAYPRIIAFGGSFVVLFLLATLATRGNPLRFLIGLDNRYSNSQCQLVLWFGALAVIYVSAVLLRLIYLKGNFIGGVSVTANVIALTGLSALSFGGAKVITSQKTAPGSTPAAPSDISDRHSAAHKTHAHSPNLLTDLFQNDRGDADFGDFQMILITLATVGIFVSSCFVFLGNLWPDASTTLPDIDTTLLSAFGVGQGAYLIKKAAMKPGEG